MTHHKTLAASLIPLMLLGGCSTTYHSGLQTAHMDKSIKPGDDFFRYSNGHWLATSTIAADRPGDGAFYALRYQSLNDVRMLVNEAIADKAEAGSSSQQIADLYQSFMDRKTRDALGLSPIQPQLGEIERVQSPADLAQAFARSARMGGKAPFAFWIGADNKSPNSYSITLYQSGLGLPGRDYYLKDDPRSQALRQRYQTHIAAMLARTGVPQNEAILQAARVLELETRLARIQWDKVTLRDREKGYNPANPAELKKVAPHFDWDRWQAETGLTGVDRLILGQPSYLSALDTLLQETQIADWRAFLRWHLINEWAPYLDSETDRLNFAFFGATLSGTSQQRPDWERALGILDQHLGEAVGERYVARYFPPKARARMEQMVENLRAAYGQSIRDLDWMSEATKARAREKLAKLRLKIGYPNQWKQYAAITIKRDDLVGNLLRAYQFEHADQLARLGKPVDRSEWHMTPQTVNAYYNPSNNEIVFPAAILQPPFFDMQADDAVNYGAIGGVIGHEMGHGFDDQGAKYDGDGMLRNWWTKEDLKEFRFRTSRLVAQFNRFEPMDGQFINGAFTLGENIGDLGGLTIAHKAYRLSLEGKAAPLLDGYTGEQRFFLGWAQIWKSKYRPELMQMLLRADPHSPPEFRVNGVVPNLPAFYEAFDVGPGDKLYLPPEKRVKIW